MVIDGMCGYLEMWLKGFLATSCKELCVCRLIIELSVEES